MTFDVGFRIEPLSNAHDRSSFSSGVPALDRYLKARAGQDARRWIASCFVMVDNENRVVGYHTLSAADINIENLPDANLKKLPRYPAFPAVLMGRLAVDSRYQGQGLGGLLLFDAFRRALQSEIAVFAFVVDPKDEAAESFYARYKFVRLLDYQRRMFLPVAEILKFFADI